jgi:23S rRNA (cytidine2498-2'-O)-methyltransferase
VKHLLLCGEDSENELRAEVTRSFPGAKIVPLKPLLFEASFDLAKSDAMPFLPHARQLLPNAAQVRAESIRAWAEEVFRVICERVPEDQPWALHIEPHYGARPIQRMGARAWHSMSRREPSHPQKTRPGTFTNPDAGKNRCALILETVADLLRKKRRRLLARLHSTPTPFSPTDTLVQACLTGPDAGHISVAPAPLPYELRHMISFLPLGKVEVAADKEAPSRAFAKLLEAGIRLGRQIQPGETCVDLGAAPGSWTYAAVTRGARVLAVDRSPLREDLMRHDSVEFIPHDAFSFVPSRPVDWLLCDVIAEPGRTAELLLKWLRNKWCDEFVVTLKLKDSPETFNVLDMVAREAAPFTSELRIHHLCANKKEVCVFGVSRNDRAAQL